MHHKAVFIKYFKYIEDFFLNMAQMFSHLCSRFVVFIWMQICSSKDLLMLICYASLKIHAVPLYNNYIKVIWKLVLKI